MTLNRMKHWTIACLIAAATLSLSRGAETQSPETPAAKPSAEAKLTLLVAIGRYLG